MTLRAQFAGMVATVNGKAQSDMGAAFRAGYDFMGARERASGTANPRSSGPVVAVKSTAHPELFSPFDGASGTLNEPAAGGTIDLSRRFLNDYQI